MHHITDSGSRREQSTGLFQEYVNRRVGNAQFLTGTGLVAAVAGRRAAGRSHADDRLRLGETPDPSCDLASSRSQGTALSTGAGMLVFNTPTTLPPSRPSQVGPA